VHVSMLRGRWFARTYRAVCLASLAGRLGALVERFVGFGRL
jgi:hypothetical protein